VAVGIIWVIKEDGCWGSYGYQRGWLLLGLERVVVGVIRVIREGGY
jgi:hypothetical protein